MGGNVFAEARVRGQWLLGLLARAPSLCALLFLNTHRSRFPHASPGGTAPTRPPRACAQCLQSLSSVVLAAPANRQLINDHIVITLFLTMLVGAGGNAGNQSSILIIRGLATGQFQATWPSFRQALTQQGMVAGLLGTAMALGGYVRVCAPSGRRDGNRAPQGAARTRLWAARLARRPPTLSCSPPGRRYMTNENPQEAFAIAMSLFCIVISSVFAGAPPAAADASHAPATPDARARLSEAY